MILVKSKQEKELFAQSWNQCAFLTPVEKAVITDYYY